jgi:O-antigen/teichoic acid export membrane protein
MMLRNLLTNRTAKNATWLIGGKVAQMAINFFIGLLTAKYLGPDNYGLINYAHAYTAFFFTLCTLGITSVIVKALVDEPQKEGEIVGTTLALRALSSLLSAGVIIAIVTMVDANDPTARAVVALSSLGMFFQAADTFSYWFQYRLQSKATAIATLIAFLIGSAYRVYLIVGGKDVTLFALATAVEYLLSGLLLFLLYFRFGGHRLSFSLARTGELLRRGGSFLLPALMVAIYGQTDRIMLKHMISETETGYYAVAVSLCTVWCFVLAAVIDSAAPTIMEIQKRDAALYEKRNRQLYAVTFYLSVFVSLLFTLCADWVVPLLYGEEYTPAALPLKIVTWYTAFSYLGVARNIWVVCENEGKQLKYIYLSAAVANFLLNLVLIPLRGAAGAALASLITQIVTVFVAPLFIPSMRKNTRMMVDAILLRGVFR